MADNSLMMIFSEESIFIRVSSLPLVYSAFQFVSTTYVDVKTVHPLVNSVCNMAEQSVKVVTGVAVTGATPLLQRLEPQSKCCRNQKCYGYLTHSHNYYVKAA
nr:PREDICTED: perilipin-2-like [Latimeria chalumnae]|eukprot:XP_014341414.1 PREDICTED: perilipin-2-like [Latimeria chalumnae]